MRLNRQVNTASSASTEHIERTNSRQPLKKNKYKKKTGRMAHRRSRTGLKGVEGRRIIWSSGECVNRYDGLQLGQILRARLVDSDVYLPGGERSRALQNAPPGSLRQR